MLFGMQAALFKILAPQRYFLPFSRRRRRLNQSTRRLGFANSSPKPVVFTAFALPATWEI
ncbi:hypothetical protein BN2476_200074 [Paraburkholderia piptadeniae]|uniref:Uncharacterized protein n=1 Tax=Paraburkholderia piptadeniae TaxID=1701573 RepID=A0A1N7RV47_9BURK|nr:hypothetical protein BN2476_200074 [Paraburkholderia piptadeniae]